MLKKKRCEKLYVLVLVEWYLELLFFQRFINGFKTVGYELIFLTNSLSLYLIGKLHGYNIRLCRKNSTEINDNYYLSSIEVKGGLLSKLQSRILYESVIQLCEDLLRQYKLRLILIGNGASTAQLAMSFIANRHKIPTLFFENANILGKVFVDTKGVNAKSSIFENTSILEKFDISFNDYEDFLKEYLAHVHSKQKKKITINNPLIWLDYIGYIFLNLPQNQNYSLLKRIVSKTKYAFMKINYDRLSLNEKYIFFPLQVSNDSQLLINSELTNNEALVYANNEAKEKGLNLVVKLHPKEYDTKVLQKIINLKKNLQFKISNSPVQELVEKCDTVFTINSTVGLEGLILGKRVVFLGKTFYKNLSPELLPKYICGYLLDIPYYSKEDIQSDKVLAILKRIDLGQI